MKIIPKDIVEGAKASQKKYGIPPSVTIAQWALESGWGTSVSGKNNYGGITASVKGAKFPYEPGVPLEPATLCPTHEVVNKKRISCKRWFKDFATPGDYFEAHGKLLGTSRFYAEARSLLPNVTAFVNALDPEYKPKDKVNWRAYATDLKYAENLNSIIASNKLTQYDK